MSVSVTNLASGQKRPDEPSLISLVATLLVAGFLSGLIIAVAYAWTLPLIRANEVAALQRAVFKVLPGTERIAPLWYRDGKLVAAAEGAKDPPDLYAGYTQAGAFVGYAIPSSGAGFQDTIKLLFGYDPSLKQVVGMEILDSRETPGLGDKIYKDPKFQQNFKALAVEPEIELVKDTPNSDNQVDAITGATISSRAVVRIVNDGLEMGRKLTAQDAPPAPTGPTEGELPPGGPVGEPRSGAEVEQ